jgi:hypothetical protein
MNTKKYIKKPIPVSALQWTGENLEEIKAFCIDENGKEMCFTTNEYLWIQTREGQLKAQVRDYIMKGIEGEFYPCAESIFKKSYDEFNEAEFHQFAHKQMPVKSLGNTDSNGAKKNVKDIVFFGDGDTFKLISKASSENEGWMKSTKAMEIEGVGCVVQVTTQQRNPDGSYSLSDAVTFVPNAKIDTLMQTIMQTDGDNEPKIVGRKLININQ